MPTPGREWHGVHSGPPPAFKRAGYLALEAGRAKRKWLAKQPWQAGG
jgi:hypothetical protein